MKNSDIRSYFGFKLVHGEEISHEEIRFIYWKTILSDFWIFDFTGEIAKFRKIWIFKRNSALYYHTVKKFYMRGLDLKTEKRKKKWRFWNFWILRWKLQIFKVVGLWNSALNNFMAKKLPMRRLDLYTKRAISAVFEFSIFWGE